MVNQAESNKSGDEVMRRKKLGGFGSEEEREDVDVTQQQDSGPVSSSASYSEDSPLFFF